MMGKGNVGGGQVNAGKAVKDTGLSVGVELATGRTACGETRGRGLVQKGEPLQGSGSELVQVRLLMSDGGRRVGVIIE